LKSSVSICANPWFHILFFSASSASSAVQISLNASFELARREMYLRYCMNILVTGGAGYIGSVVTEELLKDKHSVVVYDNLVKGHREAVAPEAAFVFGDLMETEKLFDVLRRHEIEAVIHMAAHSLVGESVERPAKYYENNVVAGLSLLKAMREAEVKKIVFSSTAAVYGEPEKQPITETDRTQPTNPYGETKLAYEQALKWFDNAYGIRYASLRYFNAAGASERFGERHDPETHLIPIILQAAAGEREYVEVYGDDYPTEDGTCVRDYIHVIDLARAHIAALEILDERSAIYNLGCGGAGYSVKQVIDTAREVTGKEIKVRYGQRRAGDPAVLIASSDKIRAELGWRPEFQDLQKIIESAWRWMNKDKSASSAREA
jgi:UDP-glucose 4-epimerase